jgi:hypothetical protein
MEAVLLCVQVDTLLFNHMFVQFVVLDANNVLMLLYVLYALVDIICIVKVVRLFVLMATSLLLMEA